jgi:DNA invertase Pin-like site-specific DNA recombinase
MTEACIYVRISLDPNADTDEGGLGVARQEEDCRALVERLGWSTARVFSDNDVSAYSGKTRPEFEAMLDGLKRGEFDALVCWHTDRLYRSMKDLERVIEVCDAGSVPIRTVNGGDLDVSNASGKMVARILGSVSRQESEHKAERQRRANKQRAESGGWWSSHRVFGYSMDGVPLEAEAELVRQAAADVLTGVSLTAIARRWNAAGVTTTRGATWNVPRVKRLLVNPRYAGIRTYQPKGQPRRILGDGDWTPLFDKDIHAGVVATLCDPSRRVAVSWERRFIGSFRYRCGKCDAPMKHTRAPHADGRVYERYVCSASAHLSRAQGPLDEYVEQVAMTFMRDQKKLHKILAAKGHKKIDPAALRAQRAALAAQRDELATLFADGVLDGPGVRRESAKLAAKIAALDSELAELARRSPLADLLSEGVEKLDERWAAASPDIKGKVIDELFVVRVLPSPKGNTFRPEFVEFEWVNA